MELSSNLNETQTWSLPHSWLLYRFPNSGLVFSARQVRDQKMIFWCNGTGGPRSWQRLHCFYLSTMTIEYPLELLDLNIEAHSPQQTNHTDCVGS